MVQITIPWSRMQTHPRILLTVCLWLALAVQAQARVLSADHDLAVRLDMDRSTLHGSDALIVEFRDERELTLALNPRARVESVTVDGARVAHRVTHGTVRVPMPNAAGGRAKVAVGYSCVFDDVVPDRPANFDNPGFGVDAAITADGAFLLAGSGWYPLIGAEAESFSVSVRAPRGILAVTAGALAGHEDEDQASVSRWRVERAAEGLSLAAGPFVLGKAVAGNIPVYTYLYPPNQGLAGRYLEAAARHMKDFADLHGPYPFPKFAVVENFFPTGFGMPSYTLLGGQVLRLPFIPETSLRHEVAHNWWGNGVLVDWQRGNWCEGLTTYVADYLARERESSAAGDDYRRQMLRDYALLAAGEDFPLIRFVSRTSPASHTVGYGKAMFVFHMLRRTVGDEAFWATLRKVYAQRLFKPTTWDDFRAAFVAGGLDAKYAERFFAQWLQRPGAPSLALRDVHYSRAGSGFVVRGTILQGDPAYLLDVPVAVHTAAGRVDAMVRLEGRETALSIRAEARPLRLEADPEAHAFRLLTPQEVPATVNSLRGSDALVAVLCEGQDLSLAPVLRLILSSLGQGQARLLLEGELKPGVLTGKDVLYLGFPATEAGRSAAVAAQQDSLPLLDQLSPDEALAMAKAEVAFAVYKRPADPRRSTAFLVPKAGVSADAVEEAARKITHYGKFSFLGFGPGGRNTVKGAWEPESSPLSVSLEERP